MFKRLGYTTSVALGFIAAGFVFLGVAWNGAASVDFVQGQIPYLLSGGAVGLGLIIIGGGLLLFEAGRRVTSRLEERLDHLTEALQGGVPAPAAAPVPEPAKAKSSNGHVVVVGRSSFHRTDCRLVVGKEDMDTASPDEAIARGLNACRVCDPLGELAAKK